jgi:hypothetical protein
MRLQNECVAKEKNQMTDINRERFAALCQNAKANAGTNAEEDLLWELLILLEIELSFEHPGLGIPTSTETTRKEAIRNYIYFLFDHNFRREPHFDLTAAINEELFSGLESGG